ncbi:hypothetical protein [Sinosporangium siamense]|uniref:hypothetical protein n=1 Tax=Sinosporangium siamense TaxID=1367973 RepID=UPI001950CC68|nr:hypothetical protein [Sinosporangium siamense]
MLVLDVGVVEPRGAIEKARKLLLERGWKIDLPVKGEELYMSSRGRQGAELLIFSVRSYVQEWGLESLEAPSEVKAIKEARQMSSSDGLLLVHVQP